MILVTNTEPPQRCARCGEEIAVLIVAATPRNRRPHMVKVATAYIKAPDGAAICPDCWKEEQADADLIRRVAELDRAEEPEPVYWRPQPERRNGGKPQPEPQLLRAAKARKGAERR